MCLAMSKYQLHRSERIAKRQLAITANTPEAILETVKAPNAMRSTSVLRLRAKATQLMNAHAQRRLINTINARNARTWESEGRSYTI